MLQVQARLIERQFLRIKELVNTEFTTALDCQATMTFDIEQDNQVFVSIKNVRIFGKGTQIPLRLPIHIDPNDFEFGLVFFSLNCTSSRPVPLLWIL
jgi:hypothetical protein